MRFCKVILTEPQGNNPKTKACKRREQDGARGSDPQIDVSLGYQHCHGVGTDLQEAALTNVDDSGRARV